ncbi:MAG TPA: hypothetical protein VFU49_11400, partial [Ktedonobacteraceae bacterium]|nr:hypothetical protein [Ktedonobacteraceae bacterium]
QVRFASDQYSLGVVTYEWVCGERPFNGTFAEIASQHLFTLPPSLCQKVPGLSPQVEQVIFKVLAKDPDQRYGTVTAFANALQAAYQQTPLLALPIHASTEHPASAEPITTPLADSSYSSATPATPVDMLPSEQLNASTLDAPVHQLLASSAPPSLQPLPQAVGGTRRRKLVAPLIMLLALLIAGGAWYSASLFSGHTSAQRQISTLNAGQVTLTATPSAIATGIVQGSTSVPPTGIPNTTVPTPTASTAPAPTVGQTPTPVPDCLSGSQANLTFTSLPGLGNPASQVVTLTDCGGNTNNWTATAVTNSGGSWLKANPSAGTLAVNGGQNVQVQAASTGLKVGIYKGTITFRKGSAIWVVTVTYTIV